MRPSFDPIELDDVDRRVVEVLQGGLPLMPRPYAAAAAGIGLAEDDFVERLRRLVEIGALSRPGPTFDAERIGGAACLAAMEVPTDRLEAIAAVLERMPEVACNDLRDHRLDMWFVIATEHPQGIGATQRAIEKATGLEVLLFPKVRDFRHDDEDRAGGEDFDDVDGALAAALRDGLPPGRDPWAAIGAAAGISGEEVPRRLARLVASGRIRRIGAVPAPCLRDPSVDGLTVWDVDDEKVDELGARVAALPFVVRCHRRPRALPAWPHNLFATVRGRTREEVAAKRAEIADLLGAAAFASEILASKRVLKTTGPRFPVDRTGGPDHAEIDRRILESAAE